MNDLRKTLCTGMRRKATSPVRGSGRPVGAQEVLVTETRGCATFGVLPLAIIVPPRWGWFY